MFNDARAKNYGELKKSLESFIMRRNKIDVELARGRTRTAHPPVSRNSRVDSSTARADTISRCFSDAPKAQGVAAAENTGREAIPGQNMAHAPTPGDRPSWIGVADLQVIDRKPKFVFAPSAEAVSDAIPFDMLDAEFSHHGNYCTFETLIRRFAISDKSLAKIGEMIHDADLDGRQISAVEAVGIDRCLKGWARKDCQTRKSCAGASSVSMHCTHFCQPR